MVQKQEKRLLKLREKLIIDSSTIIALERVNLLNYLIKLNFDILITEAVSNEIKNVRGLKVEPLKGKSLKLVMELEKINIGKGEAECIALAKKLKLGFILCDDRKLIRQIFFSSNKGLKDIKILGFSFILHELYNKKIITNIWECFDLIIKRNNWERSEVQVANYTFLKELGY